MKYLFIFLLFCLGCSTQMQQQPQQPQSPDCFVSDEGETICEDDLTSSPEDFGTRVKLHTAKDESSLDFSTVKEK